MRVYLWERMCVRAHVCVKEKCVYTCVCTYITYYLRHQPKYANAGNVNSTFAPVKEC